MTVAQHSISTFHATGPSRQASSSLDIFALHSEIQRISDMLGRLSGQDEGQRLEQHAQSASPFIEDHRIEQARSARLRGTIVTDEPTVTAKHVRAIVQRRRRRDEHFDADLFADPAWDMMLDLYASWLDRRRVSISSLCIAAAVPSTTALRWIKLLEAKRYVVRTPDLHDARRIYITLSETALVQMHRYFAGCPEPALYI